MEKQLVAAVVAGAIAPCVVLAVASVATHIVTPDLGATLLGVIAGSIFAGVVALVFTIPTMLIYVLPVFFLLRAFKCANLITSIATALAPIAIAAFIPSVGVTQGKMTAYGGMFICSALAFWYYARRTVNHDHV